MLQILQLNCNLTCNPSKSNFCFSEIEYLGHRISSKGIRISERKIKAIKNISPLQKKAKNLFSGYMDFLISRNASYQNLVKKLIV